MLKHFGTRTIVALLVLLAVPVLEADDRPPVFYFGGKAIFVGMPQAEALAVLSKCCKLSPRLCRKPSETFGTNSGR